MVVFNSRKWIVWTTMILTTAMIMIDSTRADDGEKLSGKIDLVIVMSAHWQEHLIDSYKETIKTLPNYVEMDNDKVRVAMISHGGNATNIWVGIEFPLSGDQTEFEKWAEEWTPRKSQMQLTYYAMELCRQQFDFNDNDRAKILLIHIAWFQSKRDRTTKVEFDRLRKLGVRIYVVYNYKYADLAVDVPTWTTSARLFDVKDKTESAQLSIGKMTEITPAIERDLCGFCHIDEQGWCTGKLYEDDDDPDYFDDNRLKCQDIDAADISCAMTSGSSEECEFECNRRWPWEHAGDLHDPPCKEMECGTINRIGDQAPMHMENCPIEYVCDISICTTTITTTASTTPAITTTASTTPAITTTTATTAVIPTDAVMIPTTTAVIPTTTIPSVEITTAAITTSASTTTTTISIAASSIATTVAPTMSSSTPVSTVSSARAVEGDPDTSPGSDGLPVWVIAVIAVVAIMLLLAVIIGTVVVVRKRKNAREKKEKLERGKRQEEIEVEKKRQIEEKRQSEKKRLDTARKMDANKSVLGAEFSILSKSKGAQASTAADMSMMAQYTALQSKKPSTGCKIERKLGLSSKSLAVKRAFKDDVSKIDDRSEKPSKYTTIVEGSKMTTTRSPNVCNVRKGKKLGSKSSSTKK